MELCFFNRALVNDHVAQVLCSDAFNAGSMGVSISPIQPSPPPHGIIVEQPPLTDDGAENCGVGRIVKLSSPMTIRKLVQRWCEYVKIPNLRVSIPKGKDLDSTVQLVAICVGSGTVNALSISDSSRGERVE